MQTEQHHRKKKSTRRKIVQRVRLTYEGSAPRGRGANLGGDELVAVEEQHAKGEGDAGLAKQGQNHGGPVTAVHPCRLKGQ